MPRYIAYGGDDLPLPLASLACEGDPVNAFTQLFVSRGADGARIYRQWLAGGRKIKQIEQTGVASPARPRQGRQTL